MSENNIKPPTWFWIVSSLALIWNFMGVAAFIGDAAMSTEDLAAMEENVRILYETTPA